MAALARGGTSTGVGVLLPRVRKIRAGRLKGQVSPRVATTKGKHWVVRVRTHTQTHTHIRTHRHFQKFNSRKRLLNWVLSKKKRGQL